MEWTGEWGSAVESLGGGVERVEAAVGVRDLEGSIFDEIAVRSLDIWRVGSSAGSLLSAMAEAMRDGGNLERTEGIWQRAWTEAFM